MSPIKMTAWGLKFWKTGYFYFIGLEKLILDDRHFVETISAH